MPATAEEHSLTWPTINTDVRVNRRPKNTGGGSLKPRPVLGHLKFRRIIRTPLTGKAAEAMARELERLNDYAWWVFVLLSVRRSWLAAGYEKLEDVAQDRAHSNALTKEWNELGVSHIVDWNRLEEYLDVNVGSDGELEPTGLGNSVPFWEAHFHEGIHAISRAVALLKFLPDARRSRLEPHLTEIKRMIEWDAKACATQRQLAEKYKISQAG